MERDPKHILFVRWSCHTLDDPRLNRCSILGRHVFDRALLEARRAAADGIVTTRALLAGLQDERGGNFAMLTPTGSPVDHQDAAAAIKELVAIELLEPLDETGARYRITGWALHNEPTGTAKDRQQRTVTAQRAAAHRTNHGKGQHDNEPRPDCPECQARAVKSGLPEETATGTATGQERSERTAEQQQSRTEQQQQPREQIDVVAVAGAAEAVGARFGIQSKAPAMLALGTAVGSALENGWTAEQLVEAADAAALKGDNPRAYWLAIIADPPTELLESPGDIRDFLANNPGSDGNQERQP